MDDSNRAFEERGVINLWAAQAPRALSLLLNNKYTNGLLIKKKVTILAPSVHYTQFCQRSIFGDTRVAADGTSIAYTNTFRGYHQDGTHYGMGGVCYHCYDTFTHQCGGIPIHYYQDTSDPVMIDVVCCYECAFSWLKKLEQDPIYKYIVTESEEMLMNMSGFESPRYAQDFRLQKRMNGTLDKEDYWSKERNFFAPSTSTMAIRGRVEYVETNTT